MHLDSTDKKLLNLLQREFPLTREPFTELGWRLGIDGDAVIARIVQLKARGIVRQISPVLDARRLGYQTTLVAMRVAADQQREAERAISQHPRVSHGYEREHYFNLWFTLAMPRGTDAETDIRQLAASFPAEAILVLPAVKVFKIGAYFDMDGEDDREVPAPVGSRLPQPAELSSRERSILTELQQDLPLVPAPFDAMAECLSMKLEDFLTQCRSLLERGIMRRFGAAINHNRAGFSANAMTCWIAPPDIVDAAGRRLASLRQVSHCYERKTAPLWPYNLFAMIHGQHREACQQLAAAVSADIGLTDYVLLFSKNEFKKTRVKYLV